MTNAIDVNVLSVGGETLWGPKSVEASTTVAQLKRTVTKDIGQSKCGERVQLVMDGAVLKSEDPISTTGVSDLSLILTLPVADEENWTKLKEELGKLDYQDNSDTRPVVFPLAMECLETGVRPINEIVTAVNDGCEEAGSMTGMPAEWFDLVMEHPDSKCDTPVRGADCGLLHNCIARGIKIADKEFFQNGPWEDYASYPTWGWGACIGGTQLDVAVRKLETSLESPPGWGIGGELPKPDAELDIMQENIMVLLEKGFKMSRVEGGRGFCDEEPELWYGKGETSWKTLLLERSEPPYNRYRSTYDAWVKKGEPLMTIPSRGPSWPLQQ